MRRNLEATSGLIMAERVSFLLAERIGRPEAQAMPGGVRPAREATDRCATRCSPIHA